MFPQNLICSQEYEMRPFYESETFIFLNFLGAKVIKFNINFKLIWSIVYNRLSHRDYWRNKPEKNLNLSHPEKTYFSYHY